MRFLLTMSPKTCGCRAQVTLGGNIKDNPPKLEIVCAKCKVKVDYQLEVISDDAELPLMFGTARTYYEGVVGDSKVTLNLQSAYPVFAEVTGLKYQSDLDGKTVGEQLPIFEKALEDLLKRSAFYRAIDDSEYVELVAMLQQYIPELKKLPKDYYARLRMEPKGPYTVEPSSPPPAIN